MSFEAVFFVAGRQDDIVKSFLRNSYMYFIRILKKSLIFLSLLQVNSYEVQRKLPCIHKSDSIKESGK